MLMGNPDRFAFWIERVPEWETHNYKNGLLFLFFKGELYPKELRTTVLNSDLPTLLDGAHSPFLTPVSDASLYALEDEALFRRIAEMAYPPDGVTGNDCSFSLPLQELNDAGYALFLLSNGQQVKYLLGRWFGNSLSLAGTVELDASEHRAIVRQMTQYSKELR